MKVNKALTLDHRSGLEVAIIGMSGRFPGAKNVEEFWRNLRDGIESISFFTDQALKTLGIDPVLLSNPDYVKARGVLEDADLFDASFFGFTPREAETTDPQQRLFLECAWEALESAGYNPERYGGLIGVYAGVGPNAYFLNNLYPNRDLMEAVGDFQAWIGNDKDYVTTRVSYKMNLRGPSVVVQTACSTSLVAVCQACQSLLSGECDIALAGASSICIPQKAGYLYQNGGITSPDGHCRAFDAKAQGTVFSSAVGIVVLKRLEEALADGDCIHAVIKGSAINNDGSFKAGYTAPSVDGQAKVIKAAHIMAETQPETITYIETHGTATPLGDPIEIAGLTQAFRTETQKKGFCAIGSVKTNIGHTDTAAGVAGLIKSVFMLKNKRIPPSLHFEKPNPEIDFESSPFFVNTELREWRRGQTPLRAGVSSFGIGGTNAHVIVEEAPDVEPSSPSRPKQLILLSGKTSSALESITANLVKYLTQHPDLNLADVAYTLQTGRKTLNHRRLVVCGDLQDAATTLEALDSKRVLTSFHEPMTRDIVFMFSGQGSQYVNMGLELYRTESGFREQIDQCSEILQPQLSLDLRNILYPEEKNGEEAAKVLKQTFVTQPALFTIEYALAKLWMSWGIIPKALTGHSIGEYVAACLSGVFSLEDALLLVAARGRLMQQMPTGSMLAVHLSEKDIQRFLGQNLSVAAVNAPTFCVVSGETEAVRRLENELEKSDVVSTLLHTSHAFHSNMMEPILDAFAEQVGRVRVNPPQIPFVSNLTGKWITPEEAMSPRYWAKHLRQTVRFSGGVQELLKEPNRVLLEVGPGQTLSTLVRQHANGSKDRIVLSSVRHPKEEGSDIAFILSTLGRLWLAGVEVDWSGFYRDERRHRLPLPTYPFERQRYWVEAQQSTQKVILREKWLQKKSDIGEWFYLPSWRRSLAPKPLDGKDLRDQKLCWLVFVDECGLGPKLIKQLEQQGQEVIAVKMGEKFAPIGQGIYTVNPGVKEDYSALIKELNTRGKFPQKIIHLWSMTANNFLPSGMEAFNKFQELGFYSLIFLTQALGNGGMTHAIEFEIISNHLHGVTGEEGLLCPEKATLLAACKVIPQEYANITCRNIDFGVSRSPEEQIEQLLSELSVPEDGSIVAFRGKHRWVQIFEPIKLNSRDGGKARLRGGGVYLITGGLGGVGMVLAESLAKAVKPKLILAGRSGLPAREQWPQWLTTHPEGDAVSRTIRKVKNLEELGAEVLIGKGDVADENQMWAMIARAEKQFGGINGVIHTAGIFVDAPVEKISRDICEQHFQSKVNGLFILEKVLEGRAIDFCLLTSSLSSVLGGIGYAGYAAANLFVDAFVQRHNQSRSVPWISVNWNGWQLNDEESTERRNELAELAIKPKEGAEVFQRILSWDLGNQIIVSTGDLQGRVNKWIKLESLRETEQVEKNELPSYAKVDLKASPKADKANIESKTSRIIAQNQLEAQLANIWEKLLGIEPIGIHDNFFALGGNSLLALRLLAQVEKIFGRKIPLATFFQVPSVEQLASILDQKNGFVSHDSLVLLQKGAFKPPLFCIPGNLGNVFTDLGYLAKHLGPDQPVYGLQDSAKNPSRVEALAAKYIDAIRGVQRNGPYFLAGVCSGGTIAFEMANRLLSEGEKVSLLALIEPPPPRTSYWNTPAFVISRLTKRLRHDSRSQSQISGGEHMAYLLLKLKLIANVWALSRYVPRPYPGCMHLFLTAETQATRYSLPWCELALGGAEVYTIPGTHSEITGDGRKVEEAYMQTLGEKLRHCIDFTRSTK